MLYFPQLLTGATVQYPFVKQRGSRTAETTHLDGSVKRLPDPAGSTTRWQLQFTGLTEEERATLESFFAATEGRLLLFTFLDPADNLLLWSEDLSAAAWVRDPLLQTTAGTADPDGGSRAARIDNAGAAPQSIHQDIAAPAWFQYCFSFYVRSEVPTRFAVYRASGMTEASMTVEAGTGWSRIQHSGSLESSEETIAFGIRVEAGASLHVYGLQVEAQPGASTYRKTTSRSGVHATARFDDDALSITADGPGSHSCPVRVVAAHAS